MRILTNVTSINAQRNLSNANSALSQSLERLSSGRRINKAGDDAAGLAISERLISQTRGISQAMRNAADGVSMIQTAEGALSTTQSILQRMRELAVQAANGALSDTERSAIQQEFSALNNEINRIANTTRFGTQNLLNGGLGQTFVSTGSMAASVGITQVRSQGIASGSYTITASAGAG
ncbi:MAG: flagellin, partial [Dehalococcoidia bacterium]|nr:flagellin [Dehalococcoidia bacterium]